MAQQIDVLARLVYKDGSDNRPISFTLSDKTVTEAIWHRVEVAAGTSAATPHTTQIGLGGIAETGNQVLMVKSDKVVRVQFLTRLAGTSTDLTSIAGYGVDLVSNGFMAAYRTAGVTTLWVSNAGTLATTDLATVEVAVFEV